MPAPAGFGRYGSDRRVKPIEIIMACEASRTSIGEVGAARIEPSSSQSAHRTMHGQTCANTSGQSPALMLTESHTLH